MHHPKRPGATIRNAPGRFFFWGTVVGWLLQRAHGGRGGVEIERSQNGLNVRANDAMRSKPEHVGWQRLEPAAGSLWGLLHANLAGLCAFS